MSQVVEKMEEVEKTDTETVERGMRIGLSFTSHSLLTF